MSGKRIPVSSKVVRNWFAENPDKVPAGAEVSVRVSCKGRIKPTAVEAFNKAGKTHGMRYDEGAEATVPVSFKAKNHRMVTEYLPKSRVRALAGKAGSRGPLSKSDMERVSALLAEGVR